MKQLRSYNVVGYLSADIEYGFLTPVYSSKGKLFIHELSSDKKGIISFTPCKKMFIAIDNGPTKHLGEPGYVIFKNGSELITGSMDAELFLQKLKEIYDNLSPHYQHAVEELRDFI